VTADLDPATATPAEVAANVAGWVAAATDFVCDVPDPVVVAAPAPDVAETPDTLSDLTTLDLAGLTAEAERLGYTREVGAWGFRWVLGDQRRLVSLDAPLALWWSEPHRPHDGEAAALRWLLATPEAQRLRAIVDAAEAMGHDKGYCDGGEALARGLSLALTAAGIAAPPGAHTAVEHVSAQVETIPVALAEAEARGRDAERAAVVARDYATLQAIVRAALGDDYRIVRWTTSTAPPIVIEGGK
jgi:hypothetical protein